MGDGDDGGDRGDGEFGIGSALMPIKSSLTDDKSNEPVTVDSVIKFGVGVDDGGTWMPLGNKSSAPMTADNKSTFGGGEPAPVEDKISSWTTTLLVFVWHSCRFSSLALLPVFFLLYLLSSLQPFEEPLGVPLVGDAVMEWMMVHRLALVLVVSAVGMLQICHQCK